MARILLRKSAGRLFLPTEDYCEFSALAVKRRRRSSTGREFFMKGDRDGQERLVAAMLPNLIHDSGWEIQLDLHSVFPYWREIADEDTAAHAEPLKIITGILWVEVENSGWMQQLQYRKPFLLKSINAFLKKSRIRDIRYVLPEGKEQELEKTGKMVRFVAPSAAEVRKFERQIESIADTASREALMRFWYLAHACQRDEE
jgi:hypothetical protein